MSESAIQTAPEAHEFKNDLVQFSVQRKPGCVVEFHVQASAAIVKSARQKAIRAVAKEVSIPGFRKGKAPDAMILKNHSSVVDKQWQEQIANSAYPECQKLAKVPLLSDSRITFDMRQHSAEGATLILTFETEPTPPQVDPKALTLKSEKRPEVNEEKVNETIRQTQLFFAEWKNITDRPVQEGDFVLLDVDVIEEQPHQRLFSNTRFEVKDKSMAKWMKDLVLGQTAGATLEGVSVPDEDAKTEDKEALKPKKVQLHIKAVESATLPELDEKFFKQLGVSSLEEMRTNIERLLNNQADAHVKTQLREQVNEILLTQYRFDLPSALIHKEARFRLKQLFEDQQFRQYWEQMSEDDRKNAIKSISEQSEKALRMFYLCRKILHDAKVTISPDDLPKAPTTMLDALFTPNPYIHPPGQSEMHQAEAYSRILLEKAEDFLIANANLS